MNGMETAFVPNTRDAVQLIKLITAVIIAYVYYCASATSKLELLDLKRIVKLPFVEEPFQFGAISDPHAHPNREVRFVWSIRFAHGISTQRDTRSATAGEREHVRGLNTEVIER